MFLDIFIFFEIIINSFFERKKKLFSNRSHFFFFSIQFRSRITSQDGCPNFCSKHGLCLSSINRTTILEQNQDVHHYHHIDVETIVKWRCHCDDGWYGNDCSSPQETNCQDEIDNDHGNKCEIFLLFFLGRLNGQRALWAEDSEWPAKVQKSIKFKIDKKNGS